MNEFPPPLCTSIAGAPSWNYYLITAAPSSWNGRQDAPLPIGNQKCTLFQKYKHFEGSFFLDQDILSQILLCFHHLLQPSLLAKKSPPRIFFLKGEGEQDFFLNKKTRQKKAKYCVCPFAGLIVGSNHCIILFHLHRK